MDKGSITALQAIEEKAKANGPIPSATNNAPPSPASDLWLGFNAYNKQLKAAKKAVADWFNEGIDQGAALVLAGGYGCGKTHLARVVVRAYGADLANVYMLSEPDLIAQIRATYDGDGSEKMILSMIARCKLLILDDVGTAHVKAESQTWLEDIYWRIFNRRAEMKLGTLVTTNLTFEQLAARLGGKAASRLTGMMGSKKNYVSMFGVADYRMRGWK